MPEPTAEEAAEQSRIAAEAEKEGAAANLDAEKMAAENAEKTYARLRDYLKHEDSLINWRMTWNFALQTLLLGGFGYLYRSASTTQSTDPKMPAELYRLHTIGELGMPILGLFIGAASYVGVVAAQRSISKLAVMWRNAELGSSKHFPELAGGGSNFASTVGIFASIGPIVALLATWTVILGQQQKCAAIIVALVILVALSCTIRLHVIEVRAQKKLKPD